MRIIPLLFAVALAGSPSLRPSSQTGPFDYDVVTIAPNVYGFFEKEMNGIVSGNIVAVVGSDATMIFDAGHHPLVTRQVIADLQRLTSKPVRYVVVSHWHDDHWAGSAEFANAFPGLQIIAHPFTADMMEHRKATFRGEACKAELQGSLPPLREQLASGKRPDGSTLPESSIARLRKIIAALEAQMIECDAMVYRAADRRVDSATTLDLGGRKVAIRFLGRGNTAGDLIAYLPDERIVLTGDLLVAPVPFATEPYITEWASVLRAIDRMNPSIIVPGHGPVMHDMEYLRAVAALLESIDKQARAAFHEGMTADELRAKIDLSAAREHFAHGDRLIGLNFDAQMKGSAVDRMWQQLSGKWQPEGGE